MALSPAEPFIPRIDRASLRREWTVRERTFDPVVSDPVLDTGNLVLSRRAFLMQPNDGLALRYDFGSGLAVRRGDDVAEADMRLWSEGFARGLVAWMNGFPVLHASAVRCGDRAIALAGPSGAGKSTLVAGLAGRGFELLEDDGVVIEPVDGRLLAVPGRNTVRLWERSDALVECGPGRPLAHLPGKAEHSIGGSHDPDAQIALQDLLILEPGDHEPTAPEQVTGRDKLTQLHQVLFREYLLPDLLGSGALALVLLRLAQQLRIWTMTRPRDPRFFSVYLDVVERWMRSLERQADKGREAPLYGDSRG